jgi:hypothetical protein
MQNQRTTIQQWRRSSSGSRNGDAQHVKGPPEEQVLTKRSHCRIVDSSSFRSSHRLSILLLLLRLLLAFVAKAGVAGAGGVVAERGGSPVVEAAAAV